MASEWPSMSCLCAQCRRSSCHGRTKREDVWIRRNSPTYLREQAPDTTQSLHDLYSTQRRPEGFLFDGNRFYPKKVRLGITTVYGSTQSLIDSDLLQAHEAIWKLKSSIPRLSLTSSQPIAASSPGYNFICNCGSKQRSHSCDARMTKIQQQKGILRGNTPSVRIKVVGKTQTKKNERSEKTNESKNSSSRSSRPSLPRRTGRNLRDFAQSIARRMPRGIKQMFNGGGKYVPSFLKIYLLCSRASEQEDILGQYQQPPSNAQQTVQQKERRGSGGFLQVTQRFVSNKLRPCLEAFSSW